MTRRIDAREILADIRSGMDESELMEKYGLSLPDLKRVFRQVARERRARARAIAADLTTGLSDAALMEKFQLSEDGFRRILEVLVAERLISPGDLRKRRATPDDLVILDLRSARRYHPVFSVGVCDQRRPRSRYVLHDISEFGFSVKGMEAQVTEVKKIAVLGDDFGAVAPFEFEAECRWTKNESSDGQPVAGFEITKIAQNDLSRLLDWGRRWQSAEGGGRKVRHSLHD